jgi:hypothetical protein
MSTSLELEQIFQNFHRSAYLHFERSTECRTNSLFLNGCSSAFPCAQTVGVPEKSKKLRRKFQKFRTVHKTLSEVAKKLSAFSEKSRNCKRRKICGKIDLQKITARGGFNPTQKTPSANPINNELPSSISIADGNDYFGDTSRMHSIVLTQEMFNERAHVDLSEGDIALN